MNLDDATSLTPLGDGRFEVDLPVEYAIGGRRPHGGFLLACLGKAAVDAAGSAGATHPHPVSAGVSYARSPELGRGVIETEVVRVGRSVSQVATRLLQHGERIASARFVLGALQDGQTPFWGGVPPVDLPPIEACHGTRRTELTDTGSELLFDPAHELQFGPDGVEAAGDGELRAWFRFTDDRPVDPLALLYVCDVMPPATFTLFYNGWVPTLDLTVYVRAVPAPGPLRVRFRVQVIQDGLADEVFEAWDSTGRLVAQSTQLCGIRVPG